MRFYDPRYSRDGRADNVPKISMDFRDVKVHEVPRDHLEMLGSLGYPGTTEPRDLWDPRIPRN